MTLQHKDGASLMVPVLAIVVWAMVLGLSPGLTLIAIASAVLALDIFDSSLVDRLFGRDGRAEDEALRRDDRAVSG